MNQECLGITGIRNSRKVFFVPLITKGRDKLINPLVGSLYGYIYQRQKNPPSKSVHLANIYRGLRVLECLSQIQWTHNELIYTAFAFSSVQFSSVHFIHSVMSDSLRPHESQHTRPPCPSPTPRVHSNSHPLSQ